MTEALPLPGELRACAAGGRRSKLAISAAVGECKDQRKPAAFSGHRKAGDAGRASVPQPSENARKSVSPRRFPRKARRETLVFPPRYSVILSEPDRASRRILKENGGNGLYPEGQACFSVGALHEAPARYASEGARGLTASPAVCVSVTGSIPPDGGILRFAQDDSGGTLRMTAVLSF